MNPRRIAKLSAVDLATVAEFKGRLEFLDVQYAKALEAVQADYTSWIQELRKANGASDTVIYVMDGHLYGLDV